MKPDPWRAHALRIVESHRHQWDRMEPDRHVLDLRGGSLGEPVESDDVIGDRVSVADTGRKSYYTAERPLYLRGKKHQESLSKIDLACHLWAIPSPFTVLPE